MADYDWFLPSKAEQDKQLELAKWENQSKVRPFATSTAVGTKFYGCTECGVIIVHAPWAVKAHREHYHPEQVEARHRA